MQQHRDKLERQTERQQQELTQAEQTIMTLSSSKVLIQCMYSCELSSSDAWHSSSTGIEVAHSAYADTADESWLCDAHVVRLL